ncbi:MAG: tetratricopeptide repeat protein [Candidatus Korobacteraceae bacterium]
MSPIQGFRVPNAKAISWTFRVGILVFVLLAIFPPWIVRTDIPYRMHAEKSAGYSLILSPPGLDKSQPFADRASVQLDWARLALQWLILAGVVGGALVWQFTRARGSDGHFNETEQSNEQADTGRTTVYAETGKSLLSGFFAAFKNSTPSLRGRWRIVLVASLCLLVPIAGIVWRHHHAASPEGLRSHAYKLLQQKQYKEAFSLFEKAAEKGDAQSQYHLGYMYAEHKGAEEEEWLAEWDAERWYKRAAEQGYANASFDLHYLYVQRATERSYENSKFRNEMARLGVIIADERDSVEQDYLVQASWWYRKAAEQGYAAAQYGVAADYENGNGVPQNDAEAARWYGEALRGYRKAAEQGDTSAQIALGHMYAEGKGAPPDEAEALKWLSMAAEQGDRDTQFELGRMYDREANEAQTVTAIATPIQGLPAGAVLKPIRPSGGTPQMTSKPPIHDDAVALYWYNKAASQGNAEAAKAALRLIKDGTVPHPPQ